jgi:hypothetical protein
MTTNTNLNQPKLLRLEQATTQFSFRAKPALRTAVRAMSLLLGIQPALAGVDVLASSGPSGVVEIVDGIAAVAAETAVGAPIADAVDAADSIVAVAQATVADMAITAASAAIAATVARSVDRN